jgi:UrcA family protein
MSSLKFDARRAAHPPCQPFHAQLETHMHTMKRILISALIAGLVCAGEAALFAAATSAAELTESVTVRFTDLNLDRPHDVARLYYRIRGAAQSICGEPDPVFADWANPVRQHCVSDAIARAVAQVDRPALSAYHQRQVRLSPVA